MPDEFFLDPSAQTSSSARLHDTGKRRATRLLETGTGRSTTGSQNISSQARWTFTRGTGGRAVARRVVAAPKSQEQNACGSYFGTGNKMRVSFESFDPVAAGVVYRLKSRSGTNFECGTSAVLLVPVLSMSMPVTCISSGRVACAVLQFHRPPEYVLLNPKVGFHRPN